MSKSLTFGEFHRSRRESLGLSLQEFCRRNGFDKANVSRLERGHVSPPLEASRQEEHARALRIEKDTADWDRFMELIILDTGRIPEELLRDRPRARNTIASLLTKLRSQSRPRWVGALQLEQYADALEARSKLPAIIRRLVVATGRDVLSMEFPAGEQIQRRGADGIVTARSADIHVPEGLSVWQMGCDKDVKRKAESDFKKFEKSRDIQAPKSATFVFVTPRKWEKKDEWRRSKEETGFCKEVRVYDSASLEEWLERAPAVEVWLAHDLGLKPDGLTTLDDRLRNIEIQTNIPLDSKVFLTTREDQVKTLQEWLDRSDAELRVEARSSDEVLDFVAAVGRQTKIEKLVERTLIVEKRDTWKRVAEQSDGGLILIPDQKRLDFDGELLADASRRGHRVIFHINPNDQSVGSRIQLTRVYRFDLEQALVESRCDEEKASRLAADSGGSLTILKRLVARHRDLPEWAKHPVSRELVAFLLAGAWRADSEADRSAMEKLSGCPYRDLERVAEQLRGCSDPPIRRTSDQWTLASRDDSWKLLAAYVTRDDLARFSETAREVLGQNDTGFELAPEKRWIASFERRASAYSEELRGGLADTLALIGSKGVGPLNEPDPPVEPEAVVRSLLHGQDYLRWASLSRQLPSLAESSPDAFLAAAEHDLASANPALLELFRREGNGLLVWNPHVDFLWAIEGLAWSEEYFSRAVRILAEIVERVPDLKSGNTPVSSLREIFLPWNPGTTASASTRTKLLRKLAQERPIATKRFLFDLLPEVRSVSSGTHRPSFRDWVMDRRPTVTGPEYLEQTQACAEILIDGAGDDVAWWKTLLELYRHVPVPSRPALRERAASFAERLQDDESRRVLHECLQKLIMHHQKFASTWWSLSYDELSELEGLRDHFEPRDLVNKSARLFAPMKGRDEEKGLDEERRAALESIVRAEGLEGIRRLARVCESPWGVGEVLAEHSLIDDEARFLKEFASASLPTENYVACWYLRKRIGILGWEWIERLVAPDWPGDAQADVFLRLPCARQAWDLVAARGSEAESRYWSLVAVHDIQWPSAADSEFAMWMLLKHERPADAIPVAHSAIRGNQSINSNTLMEILERFAKSPKIENKPNVFVGITWLFRELQDRLDHEGETCLNPGRLARLEFTCIDILDGVRGVPRTIHRLLRDDAAFFVECLKQRYSESRSANVEAQETPGRDVARSRVFWILDGWTDFPGRRDDGRIDEEVMNAWLDKAKSLSDERVLTEARDYWIGRVFARAILSEDGELCEPILDALDSRANDRLVSGIVDSLHPNREGYTKGSREGGDQERAIAAKYRQGAANARADWPNVARALEVVAKRYEKDAEREDARVRLD